MENSLPRLIRSKKTLVLVDPFNAPAIPEPAEDDTEAAYRALVLGTRDYVRKCGFSKVLIALSGGIDSALVAAIAAEALGKENVLGIGMPSPYSSQDPLTTVGSSLPTSESDSNHRHQRSLQ